MAFLNVGKVSDVPVGTMKHVEAGGKEILLANVDGKVYAVSDRCGHMNSRLSMGTLDKNIVTCPHHFSRFDVTTGQVVSGPVLMTSGGNLFEKCPEDVQKTIQQMVQRQGNIMSVIKTYDLTTFQVRIEGNNVLINV